MKYSEPTYRYVKGKKKMLNLQEIKSIIKESFQVNTFHSLYNK